MKKILTWCGSVCCLLAMSAAQAGLFGDNTNEAVNRVMRPWMTENHVPGVAVELYLNGKPYSFYYGYADRAKHTPVSEDTIFEIGDVTTVMTSLMVAEELDYANMNLKDPVNKYIHDLPPSFSDMTLADIATHTAGLPASAPGTIQSAQAFQAYLSNWQGNQSLGDVWQPSRIGGALLGQALEKATTKDYDWLFFHHVTALLGMKHLGVTVQDKYRDVVAMGYSKDGAPVDQSSPGLTPSADGVKLASVDMRKFLGAAIGLPNTPERVLYPMRMTQSSYIKLSDRSQGLGWEIYPMERGASVVLNKPVLPTGFTQVNDVAEQPLYDGNALIDKTGVTKGFGAYIAVIPNKQAGIVILANKQVSHDALAHVGREILLKLS